MQAEQDGHSARKAKAGHTQANCRNAGTVMAGKRHIQGLQTVLASGEVQQGPWERIVWAAMVSTCMHLVCANQVRRAQYT